ncbi:MAG: hypothetical protein ACRDYZ_15035 [Acidimicrobiales bacterium]
MTDVWGASMAGSDARQRAAGRMSAVARSVAICLAVGVAMMSATLLPFGAPAGADTASSTVSSLAAQAAQLSRQMVLEQLQIGGFEQQYTAAATRAAQEQALLASTGARIAGDHSHIRADDAELARAAVRAYVQTGGSTTVSNDLFGTQSMAVNRSVYEHVLTSDLTTALDRLRTDRHSLAASEAAQQSLFAQDKAAQQQASAMLAQAQSTEATLQQQSAAVTGQLAAAVAAQQQQQAAVATRAVASAPAAPAPPGTSQAVPTLPPFLRCVVHAESAGDYQIVSPTGRYMGAFQFAQGTWNYAAQLAGRPDLVGVAPYRASVADQNALALALYSAVGEQPWYDPCRSA